MWSSNNIKNSIAGVNVLLVFHDFNAAKLKSSAYSNIQMLWICFFIFINAKDYSQINICQDDIASTC